jgi:hypothetical protein
MPRAILLEYPLNDHRKNAYLETLTNALCTEGHTEGGLGSWRSDNSAYRQVVFSYLYAHS